MTAIPPPKPPLAPEEVEALKEKYRTCIKNIDMYGALKGLDQLVQKCIVLNMDEHIIEIAHNCFLYLSPDLRYENLINQYNARSLSEVTLYFLNEEIRHRAFLQSFAMGRTLLTPARKRQLAKTMNPKSRVFGFGVNSNHCLGIDSPNMAYIDVPTEIEVPPVYQVRMSSTHTVYWCHDGRFYGCGETKNFMISKKVEALFKNPQPIDFRTKKDDEYPTGFKTLEHGTLFETNRALYFIGDYKKSAAYIKTIHDDEFIECVSHLTVYDNSQGTFWICPSRPKISILHPKLDDARNVATIRVLGQPILIRVFPGYWTEMNPGHEKRRPVCYLMDGHEMKDIRIENISAGNIWVLHENTAYHGKMTLMLKEDRNDDERDLNNYVLLVELHEYRTPTPFVCTGVVANNSDSVILKCGDYPNTGFDFLELSEQRNRPKVQKLMYETVDEYITHGYEHRDRYMKMRNPAFTEPSIDGLIAETRALLDSGLLDRELKMDWMGRLEEDSRYAHFLSMLTYMSRPRILGRPSKCFDVEIDQMIETKIPDFVSKFRLKQLCEEFERVNFPGSSVWIPNLFSKIHPLPEDDTLTEGQYQAAAVKYSIKEFIFNLQVYKNHKSYDPENQVTRDVINFMTHTIWMAQDLANVVPTAMKEAFDTDDGFLNHLQIMKHKCEDQRELMYNSLSPIEVFRYKFLDKILSPMDLDEEIQITIKYTYTPKDRELDLVDYEIRTYPTFLNAQNPVLLQYVDEDGLLDLNSVYPDDPVLYRLIVQTHFIGHGYTDLEGVDRYQAEIDRLGYEIVHAQEYFHKGKRRSRGYLVIKKGSKKYPLVSLTPTEQCTYELRSDVNTPVYCNFQLRKLYSAIPYKQALPRTLPTVLLYEAIRCLYDRRKLANLDIEDRLEMIHFYYYAKMHDAWLDLIKYTVIEATPTESYCLKELFDHYPVVMQRYVAQYRPSMLLWAHVPIPTPKVQHLAIILEMWPKNDYGRATRVPPVQITKKNGQKENTVFRLVSNREWRKHFTNNEERLCPRFTKLYEKDFPFPGPYKPYKPLCVPNAQPSVSSAAPLAPDKRRGITVPATTTNAPAPKSAPTPAAAPAPAKPEDKMRSIMEKFSEKRGKSGRKTRRK